MKGNNDQSFSTAGFDPSSAKHNSISGPLKPQLDSSSISYHRQVVGCLFGTAVEIIGQYNLPSVMEVYNQDNWVLARIGLYHDRGRETASGTGTVSWQPFFLFHSHPMIFHKSEGTNRKTTRDSECRQLVLHLDNAQRHNTELGSGRLARDRGLLRQSEIAGHQ
jgi:hypothetical protein